ncbi:hypothetical protein [Streptomyces sp. NPDC005865]
MTRAVKDIPFHTRRHIYVAATVPAHQVPVIPPVAAPAALPGTSRTR